MPRDRSSSARAFLRRRLIAGAALALGAGIAVASLVETSLRDFFLSGTQAGEIDSTHILSSGSCRTCHSDYDVAVSPYDTWRGSLMANAGRDPLFWAQMTTAEQDVAGVGYFCMRCHVPMSFVSGHALDADGSSIDSTDLDGVTCHFCHSMVDPIWQPGESPAVDRSILAGLIQRPSGYGNAMFVLDPDGVRRGPYDDAQPPHAALRSPFHREGDFCGTCHDVGNVQVTRRPDGTYGYNALGQPTPSEDLVEQFPLERTYTEWKLSEFATRGVDMKGRFGGVGSPVVRTCQDCHMPTVRGRGAATGPVRGDLALHEFAGASSWVLEIVGDYWKDDPDVDLGALKRGRKAAIDMVRRAATLEAFQEGSRLRVRITNESGHKIPTGHIEGRRIFLTVRLVDASGALLREYGRYDRDTALLDESSTLVLEMKVGLSDAAARATGLPPGVTTHMALADVIVKDNRIPPRGFANDAFAAAGAPVVGATYADGQHWADAWFDLPAGAARADVILSYQTVTRHYVEALRDANHTDAWGEELYRLWLRSDKGAPVTMAAIRLDLR